MNVGVTVGKKKNIKHLKTEIVLSEDTNGAWLYSKIETQ